MRELKFRQYDHDHFWYWGYLVSPADPARQYFAMPMDRRPIMSSQQFTGLKDAHGMEIYEGDIIAQLSHSEAIRHNPKYLKVIEWNTAGFNIRNPRNFEVIGNVHQNKDLLA